MKTVVVIPAYNEAATIRDIATRVLQQQLQLIVVDDASTDATADCLKDLSIDIIVNRENMGKGASLMTGMQAAQASGADCVITLDGDGQHRPEDIPLLLAAIERYPGKIIIGARKLDVENAPKARRRANKIADFWISWACGYPVEDSQSGFRLYPVDLLQALQMKVSSDKGFVFESEILIKAAAKGVRSFSVAIPTIYHEQARASHFRPVRDITNITLMVAKHIILMGLAPLHLLRSLKILRVKI